MLRVNREMGCRVPGNRRQAAVAKALDYDATDDAEGKDIAAKRFEFRDFLGTSPYRDVNLRRCRTRSRHP
jgi:hypothetical protein